MFAHGYAARTGPTHAPFNLFGVQSPAIDNGSPTTCEALDQRARCDIGAVEASGIGLFALAPSDAGISEGEPYEQVRPARREYHRNKEKQ
jgi:hypothetical protein